MEGALVEIPSECSKTEQSAELIFLGLPLNTFELRSWALRKHSLTSQLPSSGPVTGSQTLRNHSITSHLPGNGRVTSSQILRKHSLTSHFSGNRRLID